MRPSATESLYKELDIQEGAYEYNLPAPYAIRPLKLADLDQIVALENKAFPENERATREKLEYRLKACPELCAGVFLRQFSWPSEESDDNSDDLSQIKDFDEDEPRMSGIATSSSTLNSEKLIGHIISTKADSKHVTDESMAVDGHKEDGKTIAIHSLAVDPEYQGRHIGYVMLKDYIQKFFGLCTAEQISLLAHENIVPFYTKHGFKDEGKSASSFGGETWRALRLPFDTYDDQIEE